MIQFAAIILNRTIKSLESFRNVHPRIIPTVILQILTIHDKAALMEDPLH